MTPAPENADRALTNSTAVMAKVSSTRGGGMPWVMMETRRAKPAAYPCFELCLPTDRLPRTRDRDGFVVSGPWRHRDGNGRQRRCGGGAKLEVRTKRNGQAQARTKLRKLFSLALPAPHLASSGDDEPHLLDGAVPNSR